MTFARRVVVLSLLCVGLFPPRAVEAQMTGHDMMTSGGGWRFMQDGTVFLEFNHQGSDRGGQEFVAPNWWMGMASRATARGLITLNGMFSLDPATVGRKGYRELFQSGEALDGQPLVDRQHPHDLFMQLSASWRIPLNASTGLTLAGGPSGEPALGPVAFMHRASAGDNPTAPLSHHKLDSTHVSFGVVSAALDHGTWTVEGSVFNGREPDDNRWDFDFGKLDSFSGRVWFRLAAGWELQASSGRLVEPEELEPGNLVRSTASLSWTRTGGSNVTGFTAAYGRNDAEHGAEQALLVEGARQVGSRAFYTRFETSRIESGVVTALTGGGVWNVLQAFGVEGGLGADVTWHRTPEAAREEYGAHPVSFHVFFRLRPHLPSGRMWNMRMTSPTMPMPDPHAGHQMN